MTTTAEPRTNPETPRPQRKELSAARRVSSTALLILSMSLLGFALYIGLVSQLHFDRAQHTAYADFRTDLAQATAPVGPTQPTDPGKLLVPGTAMAVIDIPEIDQKDVVFEGTSSLILEQGPGHLRDSVFPGQAGVSEILGRAAMYGGPFGRLAELNPGDVFTVTTGQAVTQYRVLDVRRAGDPEPTAQPDRGRLVLATADGSPFLPSGVLRVDADQISAIQPSAVQVLTANDLAPSELPLAVDSTAWYPLVIWLEGLVVVAGLITWARTRWGRWQVWIVAVPVLGFFGLSVADQVARLFINVM